MCTVVKPLRIKKGSQGLSFLTTYLTTYRTGAHGDKSARERVLTTFVYQKGLNGAETSRKW